MRVTLFHNESRGHFFGYEPEHAVTEVFSFELPDDHDPHSAAEWAYQVCNVDPDTLVPGSARDTATAYREGRHRSLSKGDVARVEKAATVTWLAVDSVGFTELPAPPVEEMRLTLTNREQVIAFIDGEFHHAHTPDDPGSDVVIVDLIGREVAVVALGETVTRTHNEFTIGSGGQVRDRFVRVLANDPRYA